MEEWFGIIGRGSTTAEAGVVEGKELKMDVGEVEGGS